MAAGGEERVILIAMDGSEYSDYAFDCKLCSVKFRKRLIVSGHNRFG